MPPRRYPTLRQRILAARRTLLLSPVMESVNEGAPIFVIDPSVAKSVLAAHELHLVGDGSSSSSMDSEPSSKNDDRPSDNSVLYAKLEKPTKPTRLLRDALTNANGDAWARQRHCVSRAFAVDKFTRDEYANFAVEKALEQLAYDQRRTPISFVQKILFACGNNNSCRGKGMIDIRTFAREVAVYALVKIVFGRRHGSNEIIINSLREMVRDTLEPRRDEEYSKETALIVEKLDRAVRETIEHISRDAEVDADQESSCLAKRLLLYTNKQVQSENSNGGCYLTFDEVVGNAHSAMLAGVQTISTTLSGAMLHLADRRQLQIELKEGSLPGKDVVNETLRILPPVAGLPRKPMDCDLEIPADDNNNTEEEGGERRCVKSCTIKKGDVICIDLLAFAHAQASANDGGELRGNSDNRPIITSTLQFDPRKKHNTEAAPWGVGKRKCPAGIISIECISRVIEAIAKRDITWTFANTRDRVIGHQQNYMGWLETISYRPTLSYSTPVLIRFCKQEDIKID